jgi:hypothetical protein
MNTPEPLSPELEALLAPHRTVLPLAPSVEARAIARARAAKESPEHGAGRAAGRPLWVFAAAASAVLALGAVAYAARAWRTPAVSPAASRVAPVASSRVTASPRPAIAAVAPDTTAPATIPTPDASPRRRSVRKASVAMLPPTNAELQLLRAARQDVTGGDFAGALAVIAEHVHRFRHGSLVEEREALRVKALAGLGRHEDAQRAAVEFHARFPHSVFLSTFERMKETDR